MLTPCHVTGQIRHNSSLAALPTGQHSLCRLTHSCHHCSGSDWNCSGKLANETLAQPPKARAPTTGPAVSQPNSKLLPSTSKDRFAFSINKTQARTLASFSWALRSCSACRAACSRSPCRSACLASISSVCACQSGLG